MIGVYINDSYLPFTDYILSGCKEWETRNRDTLGRLVGKTVAIIRTGCGAAEIVAYADITEKRTVTSKADFDKLSTCIPPWWNKYSFTGKKVCYKLENIRPAWGCGIPSNAVRHGRSWVEW